MILITVSDIQEMGRLCYELGSRHITASISGKSVRCPFDEALFQSLKALGFNAEKICSERDTKNTTFCSSSENHTTYTFTSTTTTYTSK